MISGVHSVKNLVQLCLNVLSRLHHLMVIIFRYAQLHVTVLYFFIGLIINDHEVIRDRVVVAPIEEKLTQHRLRWYGHVQRRPPEAPVRNKVLERVDNVKRGRCRPKLTWNESVKRDLKDWNISKEIALDRSAWRLAINVPEP